MVFVRTALEDKLDKNKSNNRMCQAEVLRRSDDPRHVEDRVQVESVRNRAGTAFRGPGRPNFALPAEFRVRKVKLVHSHPLSS